MFKKHMAMGLIVLFVLASAADKLHNAQAILRDYRELGEKLWERFNAPRDEILWYYESLVNIFRATGTKPRLVNELASVVSQIKDEIYQFVQQY